MTEMWIDRPREESISAFFDGTCKSAYIIYTGGQDGLEMNPQFANEKMSSACYKIYKYLHEFYFKDLSFVDSDEISYELSTNTNMEKLMLDLWVLSGCINPKTTTEVHHHGERDFFIRELHPETILSYFMGMSWIMQEDEPNREEKLLKFYKFVRDKFHYDISNERLLELIAFYYNEDLFLDLRLRAMDILGITKITRKVLQERKEKKNETD